MINRLFSLAWFLILPTCTSLGQTYLLPIDSTTKQVTYTDIVTVKNDKNTLFSNAKTWIASSFGDYKSVIQFEDKDAGKLIVKGISKIPGELYDRISFTLSIDCKDNKYRCVVTDVKEGTSLLRNTEFLPTEKFNIITEKYKSELNQLNKEIQEATKKSVIKDLAKRKDVLEKSTANHLITGTAINDKVKSLIMSLRKDMSVGSDF